MVYYLKFNILRFCFQMWKYGYVLSVSAVIGDNILRWAPNIALSGLELTM